MEAKRICSWLRRLLVGLRRGLYALLALTAAYLICALIGLIPINNDFEPAPEGIEIFIISNPIHADLVLPLDTGGIDWRALFPSEHFAQDTSFATHVAIGWGDRGFFLETPRWSDLRFSTVVRALFWPSPSCLHVSMIDARWLTQARSVRISESQYAMLADHIRSSFARDAAGNKRALAGAAYAGHDAFFEARGAYHLFNTCNCWVARGMGRAGLRAPWFAPFPKTVWLYLPADPTCVAGERHVNRAENWSATSRIPKSPPPADRCVEPWPARPGRSRPLRRRFQAVSLPATVSLRWARNASQAAGKGERARSKIPSV